MYLKPSSENCVMTARFTAPVVIRRGVSRRPAGVASPNLLRPATKAGQGLCHHGLRMAGVCVGREGRIRRKGLFAGGNLARQLPPTSARTGTASLNHFIPVPLTGRAGAPTYNLHTLAFCQAGILVCEAIPATDQVFLQSAVAFCKWAGSSNITAITYAHTTIDRAALEFRAI